MAQSDFVINGTILEKYTGPDKCLVIPAGVTEIAGRAFAGNSVIISVSIPKGVKKIGAEAFMNCDSLATVNLPEGLVAIGQKAFYGCTRLRTIPIPKSVSAIGRYAFKYCKGLANYKGFVMLCGLLCDYVGKETDITIPAEARTITEGAFMNNNIVRKVSFWEGALKIGQRAFSGCGNLRVVTLPNSLQAIGQQAFENCGSLLAIDIPKNVKTVGNWAFSGCEKLQTVTLAPGAAMEGAYLFNGCKQLTEKKDFLIIGNVLFGYYGTDQKVVIPDGVKIIHKYAFEDSGVEEVTIPESVTLIDESAFSGCRGLRKLNLPKSLPKIADSAFVRCDKLVNTGAFFILNGVLYTYGGAQTKVVIPQGVTTIGPWAFAGHAMEEVVIPDGVTAIGEEAFCGCEALRSLVIPASVTTLGRRVFSECPALADADDCVIVGDVFYGYYGYDNRRVIPAHVTRIEPEAFAEAEDLEEIQFPKTIKELEPGTLCGCKKLWKVTFQNGNTSIKGKVFPENVKVQIWAPPGGTVETFAKKNGLWFIYL